MNTKKQLERECIQRDEHLYLKGQRVTAERLGSFAQALSHSELGTLQPILTFLKEWWSESRYLTVQTSGSTGTPKQLKLSKEAMRRSAVRSIKHFQIEAGDKLLLSMDLRYIGAKMMVVRALLAGAELIIVPPSSHPLATLTVAPDFLSLVPLQLHHTLQVPHERQLLAETKTLIIGGGAPSPAMIEELGALPLRAYATYGMTETISHIALRKLNGEDASPLYYPLEGVQLSTTEEGQLIIADRLLFPDGEPLLTNDLVNLQPEGGFAILGRADFVINSGGIKISPEPLEQQLLSQLHLPLAFTWVPDEALGQKLVLVLEGHTTPPHLDEAISVLPPYHRPKMHLLIERLPHNANGKLDRHRLHVWASAEGVD